MRSTSWTARKRASRRTFGRRQRLFGDRLGDGSDVENVKIGDEVVVHSGWWEPDDPWVLSGKDPMLASSTRIWGYQTNYGSYCQYAGRNRIGDCSPSRRI